MNKQLDHRNPHGLCYYMTVASLKRNNAQVGRNFGRAQDLLVRALPTVHSSLELEAFHLGKISPVPITDMAHTGRTASKIGIVKIYWDDEGIDMRDVQVIARDMVGVIESEGNMGESNYTNLGKSIHSNFLCQLADVRYRRRTDESDWS